MIQLLENRICIISILKELEICSGPTTNYSIHELEPTRSRMAYAIEEYAKTPYIREWHRRVCEHN
jgi:hypothetical protein